jgi:dipeptidyl-peptidase-4
MKRYPIRLRLREFSFACLFALILLPGAGFAAGREERAEAPKKIGWIEPVKREIEGWTVHVDPQLLGGEHQEEGALALKMLANHLQRIAILVPEKQLGELRKVEIWIEQHHPELGAMQYHPDAKWLTDRGYDPRLARKVHITRASELVSRGQMLKHPAVILHELSHAYHDQVLGFDDPGILAAYKAAMKEGKYEKVLLYTGKTVRHYAATNHKEYFAEATEAYFYRNDFYPFVRAELRQHDPVACAEMERVWGKVR